MMVSDFPVVQQVALRPVEKQKWWHGRNRSLAEIPANLPANCTIVLQVREKFISVFPSQIRSSDENYVDADVLTVVDLRARDVLIDFELRTRNSADRFSFHALFRCQVSDPERLVQARRHDVENELRGYLESIRKLWAIGDGRAIDDYQDVNARVQARLAAHTKKKRPQIIGLSVDYVSVNIDVPSHLREEDLAKRSDLVAHDQAAREAKLKYELETLKAELRDTAVALEEERKAVQAHKHTTLQAEMKHRRDIESLDRDSIMGDLRDVRSELEAEKRYSKALEDSRRKHEELTIENRRRYERAIEEQRRHQELIDRKEKFQLAVAARIQNLIETSRGALEAWGLKNNDLTVADVLSRLQNDEERKIILEGERQKRKDARKDEQTATLIRLVEVFANNHMYDRAVDPTAVLEKLVNEVSVSPSARAALGGSDPREIDGSDSDEVPTDDGASAATERSSRPGPLPTSEEVE